MTDPFEAPASGEFISWDDLEGCLLLFTVGESGSMMTKNSKDGKPSKFVKADVAVLDGKNAGNIYEDTLIFPNVMRSRLAPRSGGMVLARLIKETNAELQKKYNKNTYVWQLSDEYSEADAQLARDWIAKQSSKSEDPFA